MHLNAQNVAVFTDKNVSYTVYSCYLHVLSFCKCDYNILLFQLVNLPPVASVLGSLTKSGIQFSLYDDVRIEPSDKR